MTTSITTRPVDAVLAKLEGVRHTGPEQWEARCPAHEDRSPSLSVGIGDDGRALLCCQAGCQLDAITAAIGMTIADLYPPRERPERGRIVETYGYRDELGELLYEVVRLEPKSFRQRRPDGRGGWDWRLNGVRRVLYRLPEVIEAVTAGELVWIVEGEKDADALERAGEVATCNPQGAGKWSKVPDAAMVLTGATVIVWIDDDQPGHDHGRQVVRSIDGTADGWLVVRSPHAKDAAAHLAAGHPIDLAHLEELASSDGDRTWLDGPSTDTTPSGDMADPGPTEPPPEGDGDTPSSWRPLDMAAALTGEGPPAPDVWRHSRGHCLLYAGRTHAFFGASETLKSWAAQSAVAEVLRAGGSVLYVDYEDDQDGVAARLVALGVPHDAILTRLAYMRPDEPLMDHRDTYTRGGIDFHDTLRSQQWQLAVIDGMTEAMTTESLDVNDNADSARFQRRLMRPIADTGAAALAIDHQAKNADASGRFAIGAQHKLAGLTGAAYRFESMHTLGRPDGLEPTVGTSKITVSKDRPGFVRGKAVDGLAGILRVTSWPDLRVDVDLIDAADLGDAGADMELAGRILTHLATYEGESGNQLEKGVRGNAGEIRATTKWMIGKGWIRVQKEGRSNCHYLTDTGRQETPDA